MFYLGNLSGTIYNDTTPIVEFKCDNGSLIETRIVEQDKSKYPFEFFMYGFSQKSFENFFDDRMTPSSRQNMSDYLKAIGISHYDPLLIIKHNNGKCIHDKYWVDLTKECLENNEQSYTWEYK